MPNTSWKQYGGTKTFESNNNIVTHTLVTDNLVLRNAYQGNFEIIGNLDVSGNQTISGNIDISGNITANTITVLHGEIDYTDLSLNGNLSVGTTIYMNGHPISMGNVTNPSPLLSSASNLLGINNPSPIYTLDVQGTQTNMLRIQNIGSSLQSNAIISENVANHGILAQTTSSGSSLQFFGETALSVTPTNPNAQIQYLGNGYLEIDVSTNIQLASQVTISKTPLTNTHYYGETVTISDISSGFYQPVPQYDLSYITQLQSGEALTLVSSTTDSQTFMNICNQYKQGVTYSGGVYPNDTTKSMGTMGFIDTSSSNYYPLMTSVTGNNRISNPATMGINTVAPRIDQYAMDINGAIHIGNGQNTQTLYIPLSSQNQYVVDSNSSSFYGNKGYYTYISYDAVSTIFDVNVRNTADGGITWTNTIAYSSTASFVSNQHTTTYAVDNSVAFIGSNAGLFLGTQNGGQTWIQYHPSTSIDVYSLYAQYITPSQIRLYYLNRGTNIQNGSTNIYYFDVSANPLYSQNPTIYSVPASSYTTVSATANGMKVIYLLCGGPSTTNVYMYAIPDIGILPILAYPTLFITDQSLNAISTSLTKIQINDPRQLLEINMINPYNGIGVGIGGEIVSFSFTNSSYINIGSAIHPLVPNDLHSVSIFDSSYAMAVGASGEIVYSTHWETDTSWSILNMADINQSGNGNMITNTDNNYIGIQMISKDAYYLLSSKIDATNTTTSSNGYYVYNPNLFDNTNNSVIDISGCITISGDIHLQNATGVIYATNYAPSVGSTSVNIVSNTSIGYSAPINSSYMLDISGVVKASSFVSMSDYRIKKDVRELSNSETVDKLRPVYYYNTYSGKHEIGFLAHEVQQEYDYLVSGEKDGTDIQALNYQSIIGLLVKEVQNCKREISRLHSML